MKSEPRRNSSSLLRRSPTVTGLLASAAGLALVIGFAGPALAVDKPLGARTCSSPAAPYVYVYSTTTGNIQHLHVHGTASTIFHYSGNASVVAHASTVPYTSESASTVTSLNGTIASAATGCDVAGDTY